MTEITCVRCNKSGEPLSAPPVGGVLGQQIQQQVCPTCWAEWLQQQVLFINHYALQPADPEDRKKLREAMKEFLSLTAAPTP